MNHFEIMSFAKRLGLEVSTERDHDVSLKHEVVVIAFRTPPRYSPKRGHERGDHIATLKFHHHMGPTEYADACAPAYNALKQYETWR